MRKTFIITLLYLYSSVLIAQQISVDATQTPQQLIENNLVQGCVAVENITSPFNGNINSIPSYGYFEQSTSKFPFKNGIVLTSGNVNTIGNTANSNALNEGEENWETDPDLEAALGISNTLNATSIAFDFTSATGKIQFNYILASEEYFADYPCNYSDGFAFLIKESGSTNPYTNIALVPGTTTPVNTSTVHQEVLGFCDAENVEYFEGYNIGDTNFNGRTAVLSASANITPNVKYNIKLVIADQTDRNFDSAVFIEGNSFSDSVDLGVDFSTCDSSATLNANTNNPDAKYKWFLDAVELNGKTASSLDITASGNYEVVITVPLNTTECSFKDDINVTLNSIQTAPSLDDFEVCDDTSNDGSEFFDFSTLAPSAEAVLPPSNYTITYHVSNQNVIDNINAITSINNFTNPQVIYIRSEDTLSGCVYVSTINLVVNPLPEITVPALKEICTNSSNSTDLTESDQEITNGNGGYSVTYHPSQLDAESNINAIASPYTPTSVTEELFVRVIDVATGCLSYTTISLKVSDSPAVNPQLQQINACEQDDFATFNLTQVIADVLQGNTSVNISYHTTIEDANADENAITNPTNFKNTVPRFQTVFIRAENQNNACYELIPLELHTNILLTGTNIKDFSKCDTAPDDGLSSFNFSAITTNIANGIPDITITYFETENNRDNNINPINTTTTYPTTSNAHPVFLNITNGTCFAKTDILLITNPSVNIEPQSPFTYCDTDNDATTRVNLETFSPTISNGISGALVTYHESLSDAGAGLKPLAPLYLNTTTPFTLYARVSAVTGCYDITAIEISVLPAPATNTPSGFLICDNDQDGLSIINLKTQETQISSNPSSVVFSYYPTEDDANNSVNEITNPTNYNAKTETVIAKVANSTTTCYALEPIDIIVNTPPAFPAISSFRNCESDGDQISDFILSQKDDEILNGQEGKTVSYYETQADALAKTNPIDKFNIYNNKTQIQTLYVGVENDTDESCYGTNSFTIEVGSLPIYNAPLDINRCDDITNDTFERFNLNDQREAIIANSTDTLKVDFYLTEDDANNEVNALLDEFKNTVNPQQIFVKIDNGTYCKSIVSFEYNIIQAPQIKTAPNLLNCDLDLDGKTTFDLTKVEIEVLALRQDNIQIAYYPSADDMFAKTNRIYNPANYTNTSNPQTVFIEVKNTVSGCGVAAGFTLTVNLPPVIAAKDTFNICLNNDNSFDLNSVVSDLTGTQDVINTFHANENDARLNANTLDPNYTYTTYNDRVYIRSQFLNTSCYNIASFNINVNTLPVASPKDISACDDDFDGLVVFDLALQSPVILGSQSSSDFTVSYFETEDDALNNTNSISNLNYEAKDEQTIYLRVENNSTNCFTTDNFITFINRKPEVNITDQIVCIDNLPLVVDATTTESTDTYLWSTGATTPSIEITEIGDYSVTVTTRFECETTANFKVDPSQQALVDFEVSAAFDDPSRVVVETSGLGDYVYQLNDEEPQDSNVFTQVPLGEQYITVIDLNGCEPTPPKKITIIDAPQFVTPNGDGYFDSWHIIGVEKLPGTIIKIHDRYGKLLKVLGHKTEGWDGTYLGNAMPASDYWFVADVVNGAEKFQVKGNFALIR